MYWGSVRFFKHLILTLLALLILTPTVFCFAFLLRSMRYEEELEGLRAQPDTSSQVSESSASFETAADFADLLQGSGVATGEALRVLYQREPEAFDFLQAPDSSGELPSYASLYPDLYATPPEGYTEQTDIAYLTFDDGPSVYTGDILDLLAKYGVKGTFFVTGLNDNEQSAQLLRRMAEEGHTIGVHTYSHAYSEIYAGVEEYLADFYKAWKMIYDATGIKATVFRFPGGSINDYNREIYQRIIAEMLRRGFRYYDWNVDSRDAYPESDWTSMYNDVLDGVTAKDRAFILFHDSASNTKTVYVLEDVLKELIRRGKALSRIEEDTRPVTFCYID